MRCHLTTKMRTTGSPKPRILFRSDCDTDCNTFGRNGEQNPSKVLLSASMISMECMAAAHKLLHRLEASLLTDWPPTLHRRVPGSLSKKKTGPASAALDTGEGLTPQQQHPTSSRGEGVSATATTSQTPLLPTSQLWCWYMSVQPSSHEGRLAARQGLPGRRDTRRRFQAQAVVHCTCRAVPHDSLGQAT